MVFFNGFRTFIYFYWNSLFPSVALVLPGNTRDLHSNNPYSRQCTQGENIMHSPLINGGILPGLHETCVGLAKGLIFTVLITPGGKLLQTVESREGCQVKRPTLRYFFQKKPGRVNWLQVFVAKVSFFT